MNVPSYREILNLSSTPLNDGTKMDIMLSVSDAAASGLALYHDHKNKLNPRVGPVTAIPAPWPRKSMAVANYVSSLMSILLGLISQDKEWIIDCLKDGGVLKDDEYTQELAEIMLKTTDRSPVEITLFRHDFMLHVPDQSQPILDPEYGHVPIKNVEMNTMSVALSYLSDKTQAIHNRTLNRLVHAGHWPDMNLKENRYEGSGCCTYTSAISSALKEYNIRRSSIARPRISISLMVTEDRETNSIDQVGLWRCLDTEFDDHPAIPVQRTLCYLLSAFKEGNLYEDVNGTLILKELNRDSCPVEKEICLVYWRVFYHPRHSDGPNKDILMKMRGFIEGTAAIKLPTLACQLAGTKEIQKRLVSRKVVERYLDLKLFKDDKSVQQRSIDLLISCMARQIDPLEDPKLFSEVISVERKKWVLKPQREGGGNNLFDDAMVEKLKALKEEKVSGQTGYVLMELIKPPSHNATVLDINIDEVGLKTFGADSELGIYSTAVFFNKSDDKLSKEIKLNEKLIGLEDELEIPNICELRTSGTLLRTKPNDVKEGGIHAGFGWMDSPFLVDDVEWTKLNTKE